MRTRILLAVALLALPGVAALSITTEADTVTITPGGTATIPVSVTADCLMDLLPGFLTGAGSYEVPITLEGGVNFTADAVSASFSPQACADPSFSATTTVDVPVTAAADAIGMVPYTATIDADGETTTVDLMADYVFGYEFFVDESFPAEVTDGTHSFDAEIRITANAKSMAMFEVLKRANHGVVTGLPDFQNVDSPLVAGDGVVPLTITYRADGNDWTEDTFTFKTWSHWIDDGLLKTDDVEYTFTFTNPNPSTSSGGDGDKESPGFGLVALVGLVGVAAFVARRK